VKIVKSCQDFLIFLTKTIFFHVDIVVFNGIHGTHFGISPSELPDLLVD